MEEIINKVKDYYGKVLTDTSDLKTSACCTIDTIPEYHKKILAELEPEIIEKFYGCGSPIPQDIRGCIVLDLGCGTGRDVYLASHLVGENGKVIGIDMTDEQLAVAKRHQYTQMERFGFKKTNVEFYQGYIEDLASLGLEDNSIDVIISNCVINLSPAKERVFSEIFRVLKPGGELYFSDVFSGRRIPDHLRNDPVLYGECLSGALYIEDFRRLLRNLGVSDYRMVSKRPISLDNEELVKKAGMVDFYSITVRAFKLDILEDICEDYGQIAIYRGTLAEHPHQFTLDDHHEFVTGKPVLVCGNTAAMLQETRFGKHFNIVGDRSIHYGPFDCHPKRSGELNSDNQNAGGACC
jgi:SAM-dependent methyltransferase